MGFSLLCYSLLFLMVIKLNSGDECASNCEELSKEMYFNQFKNPGKECNVSACTTENGRNLNKHTSNQELGQFFHEMHTQFPDITQIVEIGKSSKGQPLVDFIISDNPTYHELLEPEFKYVANIHGNEVIGREMMVGLIHWLLHNYEKNPAAKQLVDETRIHILVSMNPDGYDAVEWTAHDSSNIQGRRNANDVDLNRNFPDVNTIALNNMNHGVCDTSNLDEKHNLNETVEGLSLQPETKAIMSWLNTYPFVLSASLRDGVMLACIPYDTPNTNGVKYTDARSPDDEIFKHLAKVYADNHLLMADNYTCMYGDDMTVHDNAFADTVMRGGDSYGFQGGMQDYNYLTSNTFEITLELGCVRPPKSESMWMYWYHNKPALLKLLQSVHMGIKGTVKDIEGKYISGVKVTVTNELYPEMGCHSVYTTPSGDFFRLLLPGTYNVEFFLEGSNKPMTQLETNKAMRSVRVDKDRIHSMPVSLDINITTTQATTTTTTAQATTTTTTAQATTTTTTAQAQNSTKNVSLDTATTTAQQLSSMGCAKLVSFLPLNMSAILLLIAHILAQLV